MKRNIALFLALIIVCLMPLSIVEAKVESPTDGTPLKELTEAFSLLAAVDACHTSGDLSFKAIVHSAHEGAVMDMPVSISCHAEMDWQKEPLLIRINADLSVMAAVSEMESLTVALYAAPNGDGIKLYVYTDESEIWYVDELDASDLLSMDFPDMPTALPNGIRDLRREGTAMLDGRETLVYTGRLMVRENMEQAMTNMEEALTAMEDADVEAFLDIQEYLDTFFSSDSTIEMTFHVDAETHLPLRLSLDMTACLQDAVRGFMEMITDGEESIEGQEFGITVTEAMLDRKLSNFNSIDPIVIPEAALATDELTAKLPEGADSSTEPPTDSDVLEPESTDLQTNHADVTFEETVNEDGEPCIMIGLTLRPGDTMTILLPNQDDFVTTNEYDDDAPYLLTIPKSCYYPNIPLTEPVYTATPQILVVHADGEQEYLPIDSFDIHFPAVELELLSPAMTPEGIRAGVNNRIILQGKVDDHTVAVTVNGQPVTEMYEAGYFFYTYTLSGNAPETVTIEASHENRVTASLTFTILPYPHGEN